MFKIVYPSDEKFKALLPLYDIFIYQMKVAIKYIETAHNIIVENLFDDLRHKEDGVFIHIYEIDKANVTCNAYIGYQRKIYRDISISINLSIFRYIYEDSNYCGGIMRGKHFYKIIDLLGSCKNLNVQLPSLSFEEGERTLVKFHPCLSTANYSSSSFVIDEIGKTYSLPDYVKLRDASYSFRISGLINHKYPLVGTSYYAPNYDKNKTISCVLVALTDNEYDRNAIKVLRWFPAQRIKESPSPDLYELGYISRTDNSELHTYMSKKNETNVLFGEITNDKITILGGLELFVDRQYKNIELPIQLSNHIQL